MRSPRPASRAILGEVVALAAEAWMESRALAEEVIREITDELQYPCDPKREHEDKSLERKQALEKRKARWSG
jgi:hypothetical protein